LRWLCINGYNLEKKGILQVVDYKDVPPLPPENHNTYSHLALLLGAGPDMPNRKEYLFFLTASVIFVLGTLGFLGYIYLDPLRRNLVLAVLEPERLRAALELSGSWAPLAFIVLQALDAVILFWSLPLEVAGGFLFGLPLGVLYSALGHALGATVAFFLGRWLDKKWLTRLVPPDTMKSWRWLIKREGALVAFFVYLLPGGPKNFLAYFFGLSRISFPFFLIATSLARLPSTIFLNFQGVEVYEGHYGVTLGLTALYLGVAYLLYQNREALYQWLERWHLEE
jgi:uncharacterized membrane protein YdjX (TVP38/TMEM64 family)